MSAKERAMVPVYPATDWEWRAASALWIALARGNWVTLPTRPIRLDSLPNNYSGVQWRQMPYQPNFWHVLYGDLRPKRYKILFLKCFICLTLYRPQRPQVVVAAASLWPAFCQNSEYRIVYKYCLPPWQMNVLFTLGDDLLVRKNTFIDSEKSNYNLLKTEIINLLI